MLKVLHAPRPLENSPCSERYQIDSLTNHFSYSGSEVGLFVWVKSLPTSQVLLLTVTVPELEESDVLWGRGVRT